MTVPQDPEARHPIGVVARRTGMKPDLIRAWERRYAAVEPQRSDTDRRFYTDQDVERLRLLHEATRGGRSIGQVVHLDNDELEALIAEDREEAVMAPGSEFADETSPFRGGPVDAEEILERCLAAIRSFDASSLEAELERSSVLLSRHRLIEEVLVPLLHRVGDLWSEGTLRPAHEHLASAVVRSFAGSIHGAHATERSVPYLICTTPPRQHHEMGALLAATTAAAEGWNVVYLGPDLPPEDIAAAAHAREARAVALSLTHPADDALLAEDLPRLARLLGSKISLLVGGRVAAAYDPVLRKASAMRVRDLQHFRQALAELRSRPPGSNP